jgi:hypothetical protein
VRKRRRALWRRQHPAVRPTSVARDGSVAGRVRERRARSHGTGLCDGEGSGHRAASRWFGVIPQTRWAAVEVQSRSLDGRMPSILACKSVRRHPWRVASCMLHLGAHVPSSKDGRSGRDYAQDIGMRDEHGYAPCVRCSPPWSPGISRSRDRRSRRCTRAMLECGDLDDGCSVPSHGVWTTFAGNALDGLTERMRKGCPCPRREANSHGWGTGT